jgi:predicted small metal-binding protein
MNFKCRSVGMDCDFEVKGVSSEEEVMEIAKAHAKHAHNLSEIPPELAEKVKAAIE